MVVTEGFDVDLLIHLLLVQSCGLFAHIDSENLCSIFNVILPVALELQEYFQYLYNY